MKTCLVITWFYDQQIGYLDFVYRIKSLARHYDVTVVSQRDLPEKEFEGISARFVTLSVAQNLLPGKLSYFFAVKNYLRSNQVDIVFTLSVALAFFSCFLKKYPLAMYWNEHPLHLYPRQEKGLLGPVKQIKNALMRFLAFRGAKQASCVMPIGEILAADLISKGVASSKVVMIYMGVDDTFRRLPDKEKRTCLTDNNRPLRLIYTGSVKAERGRDIMLEAVVAANRDEVRAELIIVGASEEQHRICYQRAEELRILSFVKIYNRIPGYEIPGWLSQVDAGICIWSTEYEYWQFNPPTKLFEYLAAGLPVLANNIRTHTSYIRHRHNGLIFNYDSASLAEQIIHLWQKKNEHERLADNAWEDGGKYVWSEIEPFFLASIAKCHSA